MLSGEEKAIRLGSVFSPAAPIREKDVFMGRREQVRTVTDAINQRGQHVLIYGERGVGKTSLANVLAGFLAITRQEPVSAPHINCDVNDNYASIWRKIFRQIRMTTRTAPFGFQRKGQEIDFSLLDTLPEPITPEVVLSAALSLSQACLFIPIIDEFDRLQDKEATRDMTIEAEANRCIATLSQGLPHYTHLLGLHSARQAIDSGVEEVSCLHVDTAIRKAIEGSQQTLMRAYHKATTSPRSDNLYSQVLLACALAEADQLGYFAAADVREPMSKIMGKRYEIAAFSRHLADFCDENRGPVLERMGIPRQYRFRFRNPLLQPFVIMQGLANKLIERSDLSRLEEE